MSSASPQFGNNALSALSVLGLGLMVGCNVLAPIATGLIPDTWKDGMVQKFGEGVLNLLGGFGVEWGADKLSEWNNRKSERTRALLEHEVLAELVELAALEALRELVDSGRPGDSTDALRKVLRHLPGFVSGALKEEGDRFAGSGLAPNSLLYVTIPEFSGKEEQEWSAVWESLLKPTFEAAGLGNRTSTLRKSAEHMVNGVPSQVRRLLASDRLGNTPLAGRGYSAFEAHVLAQRQQDLEEMHESIRDHADANFETLSKKIEGVHRGILHGIEDRFGLFSDSLKSLLLAGNSELSQRLREIENRLKEQCDQVERCVAAVHSLASNGLYSRAQFDQSFWTRAESPQYVGDLFVLEGIGAVVRSTFVGREQEVSTFLSFLEGGASVQYWGAQPGSGKTRLALEFGRIAEKLGWLVAFTTDPKETTPVGLQELAASGGGPQPKLLLIWDTSARGLDPNVAEKIRNLPKDPSLAAQVRVVIFSWPSHERAICGSSGGDLELQRENLAPLGDHPAFITHVANLLGDRTRALELIENAGGNPLMVYSGLLLQLQEYRVDSLRSGLDILIARYVKMLEQLRQELNRANLQASETLWSALRRLALLGQAPIDVLVEKLKTTTGILEFLIENGIVTRERNEIALAPDWFRAILLYLAMVPAQRGADPFRPDSLDRRDPVEAFMEDHEDLFPEALSDLASLARRGFQDKPEVLGRLEDAIGRRSAVATTGTPDEVRAQVLGILRQISIEPDFQRAKSLAEHVAEIGAQLGDPHIALLAAMALMTVTEKSESAAESEWLAEKIGKLRGEREEFQIPEIALEQAKALTNATGVSESAVERERLADKIGELRGEREEFQTPEIALVNALALMNVSVENVCAGEGERIAERIAQLRHERESFQIPEIALEQAKAFVNATAYCAGAEEIERLADRIGELRHERDAFQIVEIALQQADAISNAMGKCSSAAELERLAEKIGELRCERETFQVAEIAVMQAQALTNATAKCEFAVDRMRLAEMIGGLRRERDAFQILEIALAQAMSITNATVGAQTAAECEQLAGRIEELRLELQAFQTPEIALLQATSLLNAAENADTAGEGERLAAKIGVLRRERDEFQTPGIALRQVTALKNVTFKLESLFERERLADKIGELRREREVFQNPEIALCQTQVLMAAAAKCSSTAEGERLAERIEELQRERALFATPDISLVRAQTLAYAGLKSESSAERMRMMYKVEEALAPVDGSGDAQLLALATKVRAELRVADAVLLNGLSRPPIAWWEDGRDILKH
ncbi:MAG: hypothetical protein R3F33_12530 [Planctomycetota bacterium]